MDPKHRKLHFREVHFSSVAQSCPILCNPMNHSTPGLPAHHQLSEFTQTHVHRVSDASQPSHPLSSPSPPALHLSQHQGLFQWVGSSHQRIRASASILPMNIQHWFCLGLTGLITLMTKRLSSLGTSNLKSLSKMPGDNTPAWLFFSCSSLKEVIL